MAARTSAKASTPFPKSASRPGTADDGRAAARSPVTVTQSRLCCSETGACRHDSLWNDFMELALLRPRTRLARHCAVRHTACPLHSSESIHSQEGQHMAINLFDSGGCPVDRQRFTWKELVQKPISKLDDDAFTRVRIILMNGIEHEALRFSHACARMNPPSLQLPLAQVRRVEHHQATLVNWLLGADHSTLETTIGYEQVAIEVTAAIAQAEPDPYMAQVYRYGLLEDFDHMYRYSALMDRVEGKDANNILQSYTDIRPGRPTALEHRAPEDDLRDPYD